MNSTTLPVPAYVTSIEEGFWGFILIAITIAIHGFGMNFTLRTGSALQQRQADSTSVLSNIAIMIFASCLVLVVHIVEVMVWACFLWLRGAFANTSISFYYTLLQYTTVGSEYNLPYRWRLLGGVVAMAGLLTFAWSTSVLFMLVQKFHSRQLAAAKTGQRHKENAGRS